MESFKQAVFQMIKQGKCAFASYPHQPVVHVFFAAALWIRHAVLHRDHMPELDLSASSVDDVLPYFEDLSPYYFLFKYTKNHGVYKRSYNHKFLEHWGAACDDTYHHLMEYPGYQETRAGFNL